jgi:hypothetical protein
VQKCRGFDAIIIGVTNRVGEASRPPPLTPPGILSACPAVSLQLLIEQGIFTKEKLLGKIKRCRWGWLSLKRNIGGRMRYLILCVTALLWTIGFVGCATHPPAHIIDDRYVNFEYGYSIAVPEGWEVHKKIPNDMPQYLIGVDAKKVSLFMINKLTNGAILCVNTKDNLAYRNLTYLEREQLEKNLRERGMVYTADSRLSDFRYEIHIESFNHTIIKYQLRPDSFRPEKICTVGIDIDTSAAHFEKFADIYTYPCHGGKTCSTAVGLVSLEEKVDQNLPVLRNVSDSLLGHDNTSK